MKKFLALLFLLPIIGWSQVDSLNLLDNLNGAFIEGQFTGLNIKPNNSDQSDFKFVCRFPSSKQTNKNPLYVLDGKITHHRQVSSIKPEEIHSINILKGLAATSLFSSRGQNGVIVIETKKHREYLDSQKIEYGIKVLDLGYDHFLRTQPSAETFSINFLKNKNQRYVSTWNQRFLTNNSNIYETSIDYDSQIYYGLEFEYKLYMFFKFIEQKHRISFNG